MESESNPSHHEDERDSADESKGGTPAPGAGGGVVSDALSYFGRHDEAHTRDEPPEGTALSDYDHEHFDHVHGSEVIEDAIEYFGQGDDAHPSD